MTTYAGKTALITGASPGIGATFARTLAAQGTHLILVARSEEKLRDLATTLAAQHDIRAEVLTADLRRPEAGQELFAATEQLGLPIDMLINNAGFGTHGPFDTLDAEREQQEIMLNHGSRGGPHAPLSSCHACPSQRFYHQHRLHCSLSAGSLHGCLWRE